MSVTGRVVTTLSLRWLPMTTITAAILVVQDARPLGGAFLAGAAGYRPLIFSVAAACVLAGLFLALTRHVTSTGR